MSARVLPRSYTPLQRRKLPTITISALLQSGVYPTLTLLKTAADTQLAQDGVGFTLYSDEACTNAVKALTTADGGLAYIDFANIENVAPGT